MQKDCGPARSEHNIHFASLGVDGVEIDERDAQRLVGQALPGVGLNPGCEGVTTAGTG